MQDLNRFITRVPKNNGQQQGANLRSTLREDVRKVANGTRPTAFGLRLNSLQPAASSRSHLTHTSVGGGAGVDVLEFVKAFS